MTAATVCPEHRMVRAVRYEATGARPVRCCFGCGEEYPPLYNRSFAERNDRLWLTTHTCRGCGRAFGVDSRQSSARKQRYCSVVCGTRTPLAVNFGTQKRGAA